MEDRLYGFGEGVALAKELATAKFDESIELHVRLGVDPATRTSRSSSTVVLPHGTGRTKRVLVIAGGEKVKEAEDAGADFVGGEDMGGEDRGRLARLRRGHRHSRRHEGRGEAGEGPRSPGPHAQRQNQHGHLRRGCRHRGDQGGAGEFRVDKTGITHNAVGKASFSKEQLEENAATLLRAILKARPSAVKGQYVKSLTVSSTMGAGSPWIPTWPRAEGSPRGVTSFSRDAVAKSFCDGPIGTQDSRQRGASGA